MTLPPLPQVVRSDEVARFNVGVGVFEQGKVDVYFYNTKLFSVLTSNIMPTGTPLLIKFYPQRKTKNKVNSPLKEEHND